MGCASVRVLVCTCVCVCVCLCASVSYHFKMHYISLSYSSVDNWFGEIVLSVCDSVVAFCLALLARTRVCVCLQCFIDKPISALHPSPPLHLSSPSSSSPSLQPSSQSSRPSAFKCLSPPSAPARLAVLTFFFFPLPCTKINFDKPKNVLK